MNQIYIYGIVRIFDKSLEYHSYKIPKMLQEKNWKYLKEICSVDLTKLYFNIDFLLE